MSLALEIVSVANAIREGVILIDDLQDLAESEDVSEADAEEIINEIRQRVIERRDND